MHERLSRVLGRELRPPDRPNRFIHLSVVSDETNEIVGKATREVGLRGQALVVAHRELRIWRPHCLDSSTPLFTNADAAALHEKQSSID
jgi:hypothetical protein